MEKKCAPSLSKGEKGDFFNRQKKGTGGVLTRAGRKKKETLNGMLPRERGWPGQFHGKKTEEGPTVL